MRLHRCLIRRQDVRMKTYIYRVWKFAFREFGVRTDLWYALISILVSGLTGGSRKPIHEITAHDAAVYFGIAIGVYILLRMLVAPYFLWKEDQNEIAILKATLDLPDRIEREAMQNHSIELRKELSTKLARFIGMTQILGNKMLLKIGDQHKGTELTLFDYAEYVPLQMRITDILQELSYDVIVRTSGWNIVTLCAEIGERVVRDGPPTDLLQRLKRQSKLTFKILHFNSPAGRWGAFAELEAYLSEVGDSILSSSLSEDDKEERVYE